METTFGDATPGQRAVLAAAKAHDPAEAARLFALLSERERTALLYVALRRLAGREGYEAGRENGR